MLHWVEVLFDVAYHNIIIHLNLKWFLWTVFYSRVGIRPSTTNQPFFLHLFSITDPITAINWHHFTMALFLLIILQQNIGVCYCFFFRVRLNSKKLFTAIYMNNYLLWIEIGFDRYVTFWYLYRFIFMVCLKEESFIVFSTEKLFLLFV